MDELNFLALCGAMRKPWFLPSFEEFTKQKENYKYFVISKGIEDGSVGWLFHKDKQVSDRFYEDSIYTVLLEVELE